MAHASGDESLQHHAGVRRLKRVALAAGLYNGFLAAGLLWGLVTANLEFKIFFLLCVLVAGVYGGLTAVRRICSFRRCLR